ncbi:putative GATA transcription factor (Ams2) [Aspergillus saccharolyticus JOP 1030-1]|uniref:Ams2/SPT21 N-terminal domain-containing protein n=1 Tax=Aspergillus saccharolyticus JOP 1030-1 TaxID=1450539 RepID=A0A318Z956_9EURO|nr:hypothetical protein BP01DRAFT_300221 [Aspergillus saccharolyticus JOP 1030-1]PYH43836.1 hypothetical protein BP01DRAFT_300221 [Aspergillus saccharolyticus JOP 1030-1]
MESQDGISVRPMRLKVLYTFDDASKTNCLARWPHLLDIQTAALDEKLQIGVIELKTCIQAIVSASPELVAKLGHDYTVYAYDYSEYETPLVGQGMLSWVLASASPTPNAPAHQSKTMVTGRVCKNVLGLFSKGAQETLEVKLRLVPVPTLLQSEYLESMQRYRELSNIIPHEFDAQAWTSFLRQNPGLVSPRDQQPDPIASPVDHAGIERFHQLLSEGSTPRELPSVTANASMRSVSPAQSALGPVSRIPTPAQQHEQHTQQLQHHHPDRSYNDSIRPSSSASMRDSELPVHSRYAASRRGSIQSGYGSCDESSEQQPRKRAKLYRAEWPGKSDLNIERQPSSLRVAASTAASVRIHRPTPVNPAIAAAQNSNEEPVRPPTPISHAPDLSRRARPPPSLLRESSLHTPYTSPYPMSDDHPTGDNHSPESRYHGLFEPSFSMPSSPPVLESGFLGRSSPVLPPMADSGFMSGGMDELLDDEIGTPLDDSVSTGAARGKRIVRTAVHASSPITAPTNMENFPAGAAVDHSTKERASAPVRGPASNAGSRPSSRASMRQAPKPLAPAPMSQSELEQLISAIPASDPILPSHLHTQNAQPWAGPMSDFTAAETPAPQPVLEDGKIRSGTGARRLRQVQARLDRCIKSGQVPPYCENCGAIETPTWRRAWSKEFEGSEDDANELTKDPTMLFWQAVERDDQEKVIKFKVYKKSLADTDNDFVQVLLCNPCGLWLHKFKCMRPENKWNKTASNKRKRPPRNRKGGGPLSTNNNNNPATRHRARAESSKADESSPGASDASSPAVDDATPRGDDDNNEAENHNEQENDELQGQPAKRRRANSLEPRKSTDTAASRWKEQDPVAALRNAIQSSPARILGTRNAPAPGENALTPKSVRRVLFPNSNESGPLRVLGDSSVNSPRRSPRNTRMAEKQADDKENQTATDLNALFESPSFGFDMPVSPTPRRRNQRSNLLSEKRHSLPCISPSAKARRGFGADTSPTKITAQRLQRIQSSPGPIPRQHKMPKQVRSNLGDLELPVDGFGFEGMDNMIVDIFSDAPSAAATDALFGVDKCATGNNWPDWIPSDYVSPTGSDEPATGDSGASGDDPRDLLNALISDPELQKNNQFDIFNYVETNVLDSGFFGSDAVNPETVPALGVKDKAESSRSEAQPSV